MEKNAFRVTCSTCEIDTITDAKGFYEGVSLDFEYWEATSPADFDPAEWWADGVSPDDLADGITRDVEIVVYVYAADSEDDSNPLALFVTRESWLRERLQDPETFRVTKTFRVYGYDGHRQAVSFGSSSTFSARRDGHDVNISLHRSDLTGTNAYAELVITANSADLCYDELIGQLSDGIFENYRYGDVMELVSGEWVRINDRI